MIKNINFVSKFKKANFLSIIFFILSIIFITFKGLNYGIDFKGGTLIELRTEKTVQAYSIRNSLRTMDLGDINVKKFGKEGDFLVKVEQKNTTNNNLIPEIKEKLTNNLNSIVNFRKQHGGFKLLEDLKKIHILDNKLYYKIVPYLTIK